MAEKQYPSTDLTVTWNSDVCIHSKRCWKELGSVFRPQDRPWVDVDGASDTEIAAQIDRCPSGALGYIRTSGSAADGGTGEATDTTETAAATATDSDAKSAKDATVTVQPTADGPYEIRGEMTLLDQDGNEVRSLSKVYLCRCGGSNSKPFCDGTHKRIGFKSS